MKPHVGRVSSGFPGISVLSVEPYGMKRFAMSRILTNAFHFSALGRAVWDETRRPRRSPLPGRGISVLSVEPYGMKPGSWRNSP